MSYVLIVDDDPVFSEMAVACVREYTTDEPIVLPIDEQLVLTTIRRLKVDVSLILVAVRFPNDRGGLEMLWDLNECFPVWCVADENGVERKRRRGQTQVRNGLSRLAVRQMLRLVGSRLTLFKPCSRQSFSSALIQRGRLPGAA